MAKHNAIRINRHDYPNGWSCFFVPAGLTKRSDDMSEALKELPEDLKESI